MKQRRPWWSYPAAVLLVASAIPIVSTETDNPLSVALTELQSVDPQVRARAHAHLVCLDRAAIPELIRLLGEENCPVRPELALVLGEIGAEEAIIPLLKAMQQYRKDWKVYGAVLDALGFFKAPEVIQALLKELGKDDKKCSGAGRVADTLRTIGQPAIPYLMTALHDDSYSICSQAIRLLGEMRVEESIPELVSIISGTDSGLANESVSALVHLGDKGQAAIRNLARSESPLVRRRVFQALRPDWYAGYDGADLYHANFGGVDIDMCQALFDDYWQVSMAAYEAFADCDRFRQYSCQANRLRVRKAPAIKVSPKSEGKQAAEAIQIMLAVDGQGTVQHAWIMENDTSATARIALAAVKRFRFEPLAMEGQSLPVRVLMTFTRSRRPQGDMLQPGFKSIERSGLYCLSRINTRIRPVWKCSPDIPPEIRKRGLTGSVILQAETDIYGRVRSCTTLSRAHPLLEKLARTAMLRWVYEPNILSGIPQSHAIQAHFRFFPHGIVAISEQTLW